MHLDVATWKSDISSKVSFLRQNLKKQVIPAAWKHTLNTQEVYFVTVLKRSNRFDLSEDDIDNVDVIVEIVDEFIFNEGKELSAMQELQLLEILCGHFQAHDDDIGRCLQFATMFNLSPHDEMKVVVYLTVIRYVTVICLNLAMIILHNHMFI